ncbi:MAG: DUF5054 domain-containing protein [bacterium]
MIKALDELEPNKAVALTPPGSGGVDPSVRKVILICKNHLDLGFTESVAKVTHDAINWMLPVAIGQSEILRKEGLNFVWTVPAWTAFRALELHAGNSLKQIEQAMERGDVAWHALPFTMHCELLDPELFNAGLALARRLDQRFGKTTIAAKATDVPGNTRGIVPLLAAAGVRLLHIGVNHMSAVPDVPPVFRWRDRATGSEVTTIYCRGYGADHRIDGADTVLAFRMVGDNCEVPSLDDIRAWFDAARRKWPHANIAFGRLDEFAEAIEPLTGSFPVVDQEIGDTWIHGGGTDPWKLSRYRALLRLHKEWLRSERLLPARQDYVTFTTQLLCVPEHTWGVSITPHLLGDLDHYRNADFDRVRHRGTFRMAEASWQEQRDYIERAVEALADRTLAEEAEASFRELIPVRPDLQGFQPLDPDAPLEAGPWRLRFAAGGISSLVDSETGREWVTGGGVLGRFGYQTRSVTEMRAFVESYTNGASWAGADFGKPGMPEDAIGKWWDSAVVSVLVAREADCTRVIAQLAPAAQAHLEYGAPREVWLEWTFSHTNHHIELRVTWFGKTATRLPESAWCAFPLAVPDPSGWRLHKLGREIAPGEVVSKGARLLHAIQDGVVWRGTNGQSVWIESKDACLVAPGQPSLGLFDDRFKDLAGGMHFNLHNNFWGTNFPAWYDDDAVFRFALVFSE